MGADDATGVSPDRLASVTTLAELAEVLHALRRRYARRTGQPVPTYRDIAARAGWSHSIIGQYFTGQTLPPPDRFDVLVRLLGASPGEQGGLATALDRVADGRRQRPAADPSRSAVPAQLPMDVADFVGRGTELARLDELAVAASRLIVIVGTGGVGKTSLAVRFAHRSRAAFPDGQLFVDLRGYHPERPLQPADALAGFLRALGVPSHEIPVDEQERASRYRTELEHKRALVVLDNAATAEQVRPLLPGCGTCLVLVTSRDTQAGLVVRHGAHRVALDVLPDADALDLLRRLAAEQVRRDPPAARQLVDQCARLPLALRIAAEIAVARPSAGLVELVTDLTDEQRRLRRLSAGTDRLTAVDAVFSWSYRQLAPAARRLLRTLGLHPGRDFDRYAAAALAGVPVDQAGDLLDTLTRAHLVQVAAAGTDASRRYQMHDLLRAYAASLALARNARPAPDTARERLYGHYVRAADQAVHALYPADVDRRPPAGRGAVACPPLENPTDALAWLDVERANLVAVVDDAVAHDRYGHAVMLARVLFRYLDGGHPREAVAVHTRAVEAARQLAEPAAEARALGDLGSAYWQRSELARAADHFQRAHDLLTALGDEAGRVRMMNSLGIVHWRQGALAEAARYCGEAMAGFARLGDPHGEARAMTNLGVVRLRQHRLDEAADLLRRALVTHRDIGCRDGGAYTLTSLGEVLARQGRPDEAAAHHRRAIEEFRQVGDGTGETYALDNLGAAERDLGRLAESAECHVRALRRFTQRGDLYGQARCVLNLAALADRRGGHGEAVRHYRRAIELARRVGDRASEAEALDGLALVSAGEP
ncbi:ATP-binding protein [Luedemannella flava]